jgi:hypothetical protein
MKKQKSLFARLPFFVLIFSIYPALTLLSTNIREVEPGVVVRPLLFSLLGSVLVLLLFFLVFRNWVRASLATTTLLILFFSYGHIARLIIDLVDPAWYRWIQVGLYILWTGVLIFALSQIWKKSFDAKSWVAGINIIALVLIAFPVIQLSGFVFQGGHVTGGTPSISTPIPNSDDGADQTTPAVNPVSTIMDPSLYPDVYLIVLDGYSRADTLQALGYDNSEFLKSLEDLGFYVAQCSRSNYRHTLLSMSSTFSMDMLWKAVPNGGPSDHNPAPLYDLLIHNKVRSSFEQRGYKTVAFETDYQWDQWTDADYYLVPGYATGEPAISSITPFEYIYLKNTAIYPLVENGPLETQRYYGHYQQVNFTLNELPKIVTSIPGPKFVYAHIMAPHTPYIFLPDGSLNADSRFYNSEKGEPSNPKLHPEGYINNVKYLNSRMTGILSDIIKNSKVPPIIVLQGDHGFVLEERRFNNLMAFYFPNGGNASLYPTITPVNTFRLISNLYFGTNMKLRNDVSNDGDVGRPYIQKTVPAFPETCP